MRRNKSIYRKNTYDFLRAAVLPLLFTGAVIAMIVSGLRQTQDSSIAEGQRILEESIRRAVVTNYAVEGRYPAGINDIETGYGIYIDRSRYSVYYNPVASNIMPEIVIMRLR